MMQNEKSNYIMYHVCAWYQLLQIESNSPRSATLKSIPIVCTVPSALLQCHDNLNLDIQGYRGDRLRNTAKTRNLHCLCACAWLKFHQHFHYGAIMGNRWVCHPTRLPGWCTPHASKDQPFLMELGRSLKYGCCMASSADTLMMGLQTSSFCNRSRPLQLNFGTTCAKLVVGWYSGNDL